MPKYVVTKKAFVNGAMKYPGEEVELDSKPSWAEKKTSSSKKSAAKKSAAKREEDKDSDENALSEAEYANNPTVQL